MRSTYIILAATGLMMACSSGENPTVWEHHHSETSMKTGLPQRDSVYAYIACTGVIDVPPQSRATVSAPLGGYLRDVRFYPGEKVQKGEILAKIAHPDYIELQRSYLDAMARSGFLLSDLNRKRELFTSEAINQRALDEVEAEYNVQRSTMMAAAASLRQMGIDPDQLTPETIQSELILRSPISGYITHIEANLGQHVTPEQELYEVVDDSHMHIELSVFPKDIGKIREGQLIAFQLPGDPVEYSGHIRQVGRQVQETSGAFIIHAHAEEAISGLRPGQYVEGKIILESHPAMVLPKGAVVTKGDQTLVFVKEGDEYHPIEVRTGLEVDDKVEILDTLTVPVVLEDAYLLLEAEGGGHSH